MPKLIDHFFPVYANNGQMYNHNILFGLKYPKECVEKEGKRFIIVPESLKKPLPKCSEIQSKW